MGLNDALEKLRQAEEWLDTCDPNSQQFLAAWEHVQYTSLHSGGDAEVSREAWRIIEAHRELIVWRNL